MIERANYYLQSDEVQVPRADMITTLAAVTHAVPLRSRSPPAIDIRW